MGESEGSGDEGQGLKRFVNCEALVVDKLWVSIFHSKVVHVKAKGGLSVSLQW